MEGAVTALKLQSSQMRGGIGTLRRMVLLSAAIIGVGSCVRQNALLPDLRQAIADWTVVVFNV